MMKPILILMFLLAAFPLPAANTSLSDDELLQIKYDQKPGAQVSPALAFRDDTGKTVRLGDYFGRKPIVLIPGYYGCPMLCTLVLNGAIDSFRGLKQDAGDGFEVIFVSIDPSETPALAAEKKQNYLRRYDRGRADGWHFLTGDEPSIRVLADEIGFRYAYDPAIKQFAHPSGFVVLTPDGHVSRYFTGVTFAAKDVDTALHEAAAGKAGPPAGDSFLLCFHYAPWHGRYGRLVMVVVRIGGIATVLALGLALVAPRRSSKKSP